MAGTDVPPNPGDDSDADRACGTRIPMRRGAIATTVAVFCIVRIVSYAAAAPPAGRAPGPWTKGLAVSGTVSYKEAIPLPAMAMVHVTLVDVSRRDSRTATLGEQTIWPAGRHMPVEFRIEYEPSLIDPTHVYMVRARITDGEKLLFMNTTPYFVLTRGAPRSVDVIVTPAR